MEVVGLGLWGSLKEQTRGAPLPFPLLGARTGRSWSGHPTAGATAVSMDGGKLLGETLSREAEGAGPFAESWGPRVSPGAPRSRRFVPRRRQNPDLVQASLWSGFLFLTSEPNPRGNHPAARGSPGVCHTQLRRQAAGQRRLLGRVGGAARIALPGHRALAALSVTRTGLERGAEAPRRI